MSYLHRSTHLNNWIFTEEELRLVRELRELKAYTSLSKSHTSTSDGNPAGKALLGRRQARSFAALLPKSTLATENKNDWNDDTNMKTVKDLSDEAIKEAGFDTSLLPSLEEENMLVSFYQSKVQDSCSQLFRTSDKVKSSAIQLFKRFYLSNSVVEFHPKYIVPTVIYVAAKVEEQYISVETIAEQLKVDHKHVIGHEMILLEGVRFHLIMCHPFRPLLAFVDDLRIYAKAQGKQLPLELLQSLHTKANSVINELLLTDATFLYHPAQLALAALFEAIDPSIADSSQIGREDLIACIRLHAPERGTIVESMVDILKSIAKHRKHSLLGTDVVNGQGDFDPKAIKAIYKKLKRFYEAYEEGNPSTEEKYKKKKAKDGKDSKKRKKTTSKDNKSSKKAKK